MPPWVDPRSHVVPTFRLAASLVAGLILAAVGGLVLGEYTFQGVGVQWMAISGGAGLGALMAWVLNRGLVARPAAVDDAGGRRPRRGR